LKKVRDTSVSTPHGGLATIYVINRPNENTYGFNSTRWISNSLLRLQWIKIIKVSTPHGGLATKHPSWNGLKMT